MTLDAGGRAFRVSVDQVFNNASTPVSYFRFMSFAVLPIFVGRNIYIFLSVNSYQHNLIFYASCMKVGSSASAGLGVRLTLEKHKPIGQFNTEWRKLGRICQQAFITLDVSEGFVRITKQ